MILLNRTWSPERHSDVANLLVRIVPAAVVFGLIVLSIYDAYYRIGANLEGANLEGANLEGANLELARFGNATLAGANLRESRLGGAGLRGAKLCGADLTGSTLCSASWVRFRTIYSGSISRYLGGDMYLRAACLRGADLTDATCRSLSFMVPKTRWRAFDVCIDLRGVVLRGADLSEAVLRGARLMEVDLSNAKLNGADLCHANLQGASLRGADLTGTRLDGAILSKADVRDAQVAGSNLEGAVLGITAAGEDSSAGAASPERASGVGRSYPFSGYAITALVCALVPVVASLPAMMFGFMARSRIREAGGLRRGLALANVAIVLGGLWLVAFVASAVGQANAITVLNRIAAVFALLAGVLWLVALVFGIVVWSTASSELSARARPALTTRSLADGASTQSADAAWYPDPSGRHEYRYWDGAHWTDNVASQGIATTDRLG